MKWLIVVTLITMLNLQVFGQTPSTDSNWQLNWSDEFSGSGIPDPATWKLSQPWGQTYDHQTIVQTNGDNTVVHNGEVSLLAKRKDCKVKVTHTRIDGSTYTTDVIFPFTTGMMSTYKKFGYGYYEFGIRLPNDYHEDIYGGYFDAGMWLFDRSLPSNVDWGEIDFETTTIGNKVNLYTDDAIVEEPFGIEDYDKSKGYSTDGFRNPAHFLIRKIDPETDYSQTPPIPNGRNYIKNYENNYLTFHSESFITYGLEWLPDQIKFYINNKLWFRLEGDYDYKYTDYDHNAVTIHPIQDLNYPMPIIFSFEYYGGDKTKTGPDLSMDVDYVRYYKLKNNCNADLIAPNYDFCNQYIGHEKVYNNEVFGQTGCAGCLAIISGNNCPVVSLRAHYIEFQDGFQTQEGGQLYAAPVDNCF